MGEVKGRAARSNRIAEVGRWVESEDLVSIHTIPSAQFGTPSKSCRLWEPPCPRLGNAESHSQLGSSQGCCENKMRLGSLAKVYAPGHCATLPLKEILWSTQLGLTTVGMEN